MQSKKEEMLQLYHEFDSDRLLIKGLDHAGLKRVQECILKERDKVYSDTMTEIDETNKYCIGKLWLQFLMIEDFPYRDANVSVRVELEPFTVETRKSTKLNDRFSYELNQQFILYFSPNSSPVHNYFSTLNLAILKAGFEVASFKIPVPDITQEPYISGKVRLPFCVGQSKKVALVSPKSENAQLLENK